MSARLSVVPVGRTSGRPPTDAFAATPVAFDDAVGPSGPPPAVGADTEAVLCEHVGIDVGGTFTDAVGILDGRTERAKASSTPDVTSGIIDALGVLRGRLGLAEDAFVPAIDRFVVGSTTVTNAVDEGRYAPVGLLTTHGFRDTLRIARSARSDERDPHRMTAPPDIVDRRRIVEVVERVDAAGEVVIPLTDAAIAAALDAALAAGAETIAVCLLWSFRRPEHEQRIGEYLRTHHPDVPFSLSSSLTPVYREYELEVAADAEPTDSTPRRGPSGWYCPASGAPLGSGDDWSAQALVRTHPAFEHLAGLGVRTRADDAAAAIHLDEFVSPACGTLLRSRIRIEPRT